ncbi:MAG TPA: prepilin-type N-terminal cleavage/methylation domain-containing protein [Tepidisphaeraceae bacterium]|nr:prepilin-type N-terminal cleavage/methylation domain-containing protein [Tepidisphaeraceae bacterium]
MRATKRPSDEGTKGMTATVRAGSSANPLAGAVVQAFPPPSSSPSSLHRSVAPSLSSLPPSSLPLRRGFTLTEILIVIALIVLVIALAVPALSFITGNRSVDAGENLVSAMLSRARGEALRTHRVAGVAFFRDPATERTAMAIVVPAADRSNASTEPPGLEQYKGWKEKQEDGTTAVEYFVGDVVIHLVNDPDTTPAKKTTQLFVCKDRHNSTAHTAPPNASYWGSLDDDEIDTFVGYDYQYLPSGIGAQTINDPNPTNVGAPRDRYLRSGLVLFDGDGNLMHRQYTITAPTDGDTTHLFSVMGFHLRNAPLNAQHVGANVNFPTYSQMGVVLYDEEQFRAAGGSQEDPLNENAAITQAEQNEEKWLDGYSLSLMVNRYNGTLVRGE